MDPKAGGSYRICWVQAAHGLHSKVLKQDIPRGMVCHWHSARLGASSSGTPYTDPKARNTQDLPPHPIGNRQARIPTAGICSSDWEQASQGPHGGVQHAIAVIQSPGLGVVIQLMPLELSL